MKVVSTRLASVGIIAVVAAIAACGDSATEPGRPPGRLASGAGGDSSTSGSPVDTALTNNPGDSVSNPAPKPVASFTLGIRVVAGTASGADTLLNAPVAGVSVEVLQQTYTFRPGNGADTVVLGETLVASGTTDSVGSVAFANLKGAAYRIKGTPATGSGYAPFSAIIPPPYTDKILLTFSLKNQ